MNINELADLYDAPYEYPEWGSKAQAMLRQQQAEIEALKAEIDKVNAEWVQAAMALGRCVQENHDLKAEIAILRKAQEK